jgi:hypothetical protein
MRIERQQRLPPLRLEVLDVVRLVQDEEVPFLPLEGTRVLHHELVAGNDHVEGPWLRPTLSELLAGRRCRRGGREGAREGGRDGGKEGKQGNDS